MKKPKLLTGLSFFSIALFFTIVGFLLAKKNLLPDKFFPNNNIYKNNLNLTSPIYSFSGKITKIEKNSILVTRESSQIDRPTNVSNSITFKILITPNTKIYRYEKPIPYIFISPSPAPEITLTIDDLEVGDYLKADSEDDLRTLPNNQFEASRINLLPKVNYIKGELVQKEGTTLFVKAFTPKPDYRVINLEAPTTSRKEVTYAVDIGPDTEISSFIYNSDPNQPPQAKKYTIDDLPINTIITLFSNVDISKTQKFTAVLILPDFNSASRKKNSPSLEETVSNPTTIPF